MICLSDWFILVESSETGSGALDMTWLSSPQTTWFLTCTCSSLSSGSEIKEGCDDFPNVPALKTESFPGTLWDPSLGDLWWPLVTFFPPAAQPGAFATLPPLEIRISVHIKQTNPICDGLGADIRRAKTKAEQNKQAWKWEPCDAAPVGIVFSCLEDDWTGRCRLKRKQLRWVPLCRKQGGIINTTYFFSKVNSIFN